MINQDLRAFIKQLQQQNKSVHTCTNYQRDLEHFLGFYLADEASDDGTVTQQVAEFSAWQSVDGQAIRAFLGARAQQGVSARTLSRQLSALRSFYNFLLANNTVIKNPTVGIKAPKQPQPLPKSVDVDWMQQLLELPIKNWQDCRDRALFELLYSAGLRVSECASLDLSPGLDDLESGWVRVLGKGNKERLAPVGGKAQQAMQNWLQERLAHCQPEQLAVFVNQKGGRLSVRSMQKLLDARTLQAGLPTKMSPHRLRHACATHVLESSGDLRAVQEILGHAQLATTQIYTKLDMQHLAQVYDQAHPRAKHNKKDR